MPCVINLSSHFSLVKKKNQYSTWVSHAARAEPVLRKQGLLAQAFSSKSVSLSSLYQEEQTSECASLLAMLRDGH